MKLIEIDVIGLEARERPLARRDDVLAPIGSVFVVNAAVPPTTASVTAPPPLMVNVTDPPLTGWPLVESDTDAVNVTDSPKAMESRDGVNVVVVGRRSTCWLVEPLPALNRFCTLP